MAVAKGRWQKEGARKGRCGPAGVAGRARSGRCGQAGVFRVSAAPRPGRGRAGPGPALASTGVLPADVAVERGVCWHSASGCNAVPPAWVTGGHGPCPTRAAPGACPAPAPPGWLRRGSRAGAGGPAAAGARSRSCARPPCPRRSPRRRSDRRGGR